MSPAITAAVPLAGFVVASVGDPSRTRTVYAAILLLVALGFTMILVAAWLVRRTRIDPPVLAPLEKMSDKYWRAVPDPAWQRRVLDEVRPPGAEPLSHAPLPPSTDDDFDLGPQRTGFDDISGDLARPDDDPADIGGFPSFGGFPDPQVASKPSDEDEPAEVGGFPAPEVAPNPSDDGKPSDEDVVVVEKAGESDDTRSLASGHGNAGPGRDDRPLP